MSFSRVVGHGEDAAYDVADVDEAQALRFAGDADADAFGAGGSVANGSTAPTVGFFLDFGLSSNSG